MEGVRSKMDQAGRRANRPKRGRKEGGMVSLSCPFPWPPTHPKRRRTSAEPVGRSDPGPVLCESDAEEKVSSLALDEALSLLPSRFPTRPNAKTRPA